MTLTNNMPSFVYLVMELMAGGDLFDRIGKRKNYNERDAMILCKKMMESVCFCHENSVVREAYTHANNKPFTYSLAILTLLLFFI